MSHSAVEAIDLKAAGKAAAEPGPRRHFLTGRDGGPDFAAPICNDGYAWWYVDALSDNGRHGLTVIAMLGNVFSPYYAAARRRGPADPLHYCAMNVALYGQAGKRWAMTERGRSAVQRDERQLAIGPSSATWTGSALVLDIDETTVPLPSRLKGRITVHPDSLTMETFTLNSVGEHLWRPISPAGRIEVRMQSPALSWNGHAYFDCNRGAAPLESGYQSWDWSRAKTGGGSMIFYDTRKRDGSTGSCALLIDRHGNATPIEVPPPRATLPGTLWGIVRTTRADRGTRPDVVATFEDTPFYARSRLRSQVFGEAAEGIHESLSLDRFASRWVQTLLPFRMPRRAH